MKVFRKELIIERMKLSRYVIKCCATQITLHTPTTEQAQ